MNGLESVVQRFDPGSLDAVDIALGIVFHLLLAALNCFLGYFIYRIQLVVFLAIVSGVGAVWLVVLAATQPPVWVMVLAALVAAAGLGYAGWRLYRSLFALSVAMIVLLAFVLVIAMPPSSTFRWVTGAGPGPSPVTWVFGALFAIGFAALAFLFAKHVIIFGSALTGGFTIGLWAAMLFLGHYALQGGPGAPAVAWPAGGVWPAVLTAAIALPAAAGGVYVQYRLSARLAGPREHSTDPKPARAETQGQTRPKPRGASESGKRRPALT